MAGARRAGSAGLSEQDRRLASEILDKLSVFGPAERFDGRDARLTAHLEALLDGSRPADAHLLPLLSQAANSVSTRAISSAAPADRSPRALVEASILASAHSLFNYDDMTQSEHEHLGNKIDITAAMKKASRHMADVLADVVQLAPGASVLDVGAGRGFLQERLNEKGMRTKGVESQKEAIEYDMENPTADYHSKIPYPDVDVEEIDMAEYASNAHARSDARFDLVTAMNVSPSMDIEGEDLEEMDRKGVDQFLQSLRTIADQPEGGKAKVAISINHQNFDLETPSSDKYLRPKLERAFENLQRYTAENVANPGAFEGAGVIALYVGTPRGREAG